MFALYSFPTSHYCHRHYSPQIPDSHLDHKVKLRTLYLFYFHAAHSVFPILLHSLSTPKHFPFKPHVPHPHMALSALLNKQFTEPLTTATLKPVLSFLWDYQLFPPLCRLFANLCPPLAQYSVPSQKSFTPTLFLPYG